MTHGRALVDGLATLDSPSVAVLTDDVSDNYVSKTPFAVSEFSNVVLRAASVALHALATAFGDAVSQSAVGMTYTFSEQRQA